MRRCLKCADDDDDDGQRTTDDGGLPVLGQNGASGHLGHVETFTQNTNTDVQWSRFVNVFILSDGIMTA